MEVQHSKLTYLGMPKSVYVIFFSRVVNAMGNFVFPFMTLLLTMKMGMSEQEAGFFLLLAFCVRAPGSMLGGKLADIIGRKLIMILFMGLSALCYIPCAFLLDVEVGYRFIPWLLILSSFFNSFSWPASGAMVNDLTQPENRQAAFSLLYLGINVGSAIGYIVSGFLFNHYMKLLFLGDALTSIFSIVLLILFVKETKPSPEEIKKIEEERLEEKSETGGLLPALLRRPGLLLFVLFDTIYSFIYAQTSFSMPLQTNALFGINLGSTFYGTFNMINCIEVILLTTIITLLTRRIRAIYNLSIAGIFFGIGFGMLFFVKSFWWFAISTVIWTVGEIIHATNMGVYLANHTPATHRGRFNSILEIISGTGGALSPYIMGGFIMTHGVNNVWPVIFVLSFVAALSFFILGIVEKRKSTTI